MSSTPRLGTEQDEGTVNQEWLPPQESLGRHQEDWDTDAEFLDMQTFGFDGLSLLSEQVGNKSHLRNHIQIYHLCLVLMAFHFCQNRLEFKSHLGNHMNI